MITDYGVLQQAFLAVNYSLFQIVFISTTTNHKQNLLRWKETLIPIHQQLPASHLS